MERPIQTVERLIEALEILAGQEAIQLAGESWTELAVTQERAAAIVDRLSVLMSDTKVRFGLPPDIFTRAHAITRAQGIKIAMLNEWMQETDAELKALSSSQQRLRTLKPAYRNRFGESTPGSFHAQG
ncbi:MAG TPA: hypothetical protein PLV87_07560 [Opitutaceae bacterium]|nr:hypothetical protein [Opitutaceae bacterium]